LFLLLFLIIPSIALFILALIVSAIFFGIIYFYGSLNELWMVLAGIVIFIFFVVLTILYVYVYSSFYGMSAKKKKYNWHELALAGKNSFWRLLGRGLVLFIFIILLSLLLIVPGIIFMVYWIFAVYIWFNEPELGLFDSLRRSKELVRGKWRRTFGYMLLISLIFFSASFVLSNMPLIGGLINMVLVFYLIYFYRHMYLEYSELKVIASGSKKGKKVKNN
jgi:hypothetical protein